MPFDLSGELSPAAFAYGEFTCVGPVSCRGILRRDGADARSCRAEAVWQAEVEQICSRCGRPFRRACQGECSVRFAATPQADAAGEEECYPLVDDQIDLAPVLAAEIAFALPMQPLCRESCQGLCPVCGKDLNQGPCSCARAELDPRWEKLKDFKF